MATPTTLADLATGTVSLYAAATAAARADLGGAQTALAAARLKQAADTAALAATQKLLAALRARLATEKVQADADAILDEIGRQQVEERRQGAALLDDADAVAAAEATAAAATAWLGVLERRAGEAAAAVAPAQAAKERRDRWKAAAVAAPLATLPKAAGDLHAGADFTAAEARVTAELPARLVTALDDGWTGEGERLATAVGAAQDALAKLKAEENAGGGPGGAIAALRLELAAADDALRRWAEQAAQRFQRAAAQVAAVKDAALVTAAEDAALKAKEKDGGDAAELRTKREVARRAVAAAQAALEKAVLKVRGQNPDLTAAQVAADTDVKARQKDVADRLKELATEEGKYPAASQEAWGAWSGDVPEAAWKKVAGLKEAGDTLAELSAASGSTLVTDDEKAEKALAAALWNAELHALRVGFLETQAALRGALLEETRAARPARLPAALRGDA